MAIGLAALAVAGCGTKEDSKAEQTQQENTQLKGDLRETLATQDSLLVLVNDISEGMSQIKDLEKIMSMPSALGGEGNSRKEQIKNDMMAIQQALQERRQRLEQLEAKLSKQGGDNKTLQRTIQTLKSQIADQQTEIASLTNQLAAANIRIAELDSTNRGLNTTVENLNTEVSNVTEQKNAADQKALEATNKMNEVFYAMGTKKELKDHKILTGGFLRKTKVSKGDFDESYFTKGDRRSLTSIPTHAKKAQVMTDQPKDSYQIVDENGQMVVKITNPAKFWQRSNFLVIQVN